MKHLFVLFVFVILFHLNNSEDCPAPCLCKKIKYQSNLEGYKVQCGGSSIKIETIDGIDFKNISSEVVQLILSENSISSISENNLNFPLLQRLDLNKNKLTHLEDNTFKHLKNLKRLDLSSNSLKNIEKNWFNGLTNLEKLKLSNNLIKTIQKGSFDQLSSLKQLNITNNPLTCDCELLWLVDWLQNSSVKLATSPKCAAPEALKDHFLRKIRVGVDVHCKSPTIKRIDIELKPSSNQLTFEGDNFRTRCRAPRITPDDLQDDHLTSARLVWKFNLNNAEDIFKNDIEISNKFLADSGLLESSLNIPQIHRKHSGQWTCQLTTEKNGKNVSHLKTITITVLTNSTKFCPFTITTDDKGTYIWPRTILDHVVELPCVENTTNIDTTYPISLLPIQSTYYCSEVGTWRNLNTSRCPYISETTRKLEEISKLDLNKTGSEGRFELLKQLRNFTFNLIKDKMDVVFLSRILQNYLDYVSLNPDFSRIIIDIVSKVMMYDKKILDAAQLEDDALTKIRHVLEFVTEFTLSLGVQKGNLASQTFPIKPENFNGLTCSWYMTFENVNIGEKGYFSSINGNNIYNGVRRQFYCTTSTHFPYHTIEDSSLMIEASIQMPTSLFLQLAQQNYDFNQTPVKLIISMYSNGKFFPTYHSRDFVSSVVVGAHLLKYEVENLTDPIKVMYRYPINNIEDLQSKTKLKWWESDQSQLEKKLEKISPRLAWWDTELNNGHGGWSTSNEICQLNKYIQETLIYHCSRLTYYSIIQAIDTKQNSFWFKPRLAQPSIYAGSLILIICLFIIILTYILCYHTIQIARKLKHSLINTWISILILVYMYTFGLYEVLDAKQCQLIGVILHFMSLSTLLWMLNSVVCMYNHLSKQHKFRLMTPDDVQDDIDETVKVKKPILGLYFFGWGISLIICGLSGAINSNEYASPHFCFLSNSASLSALYVPAFIILLCFVFYVSMIKCAIKHVDLHGQLSEGTQVTENVDLELLETMNLNGNSNVYQASTGMYSQQNGLYQQRVNTFQPTSRTTSATTTTTSSHLIEDSEHSANAQLKSYIIVLLLFLICWITGALSCKKFLPFIYVSEDIFSLIYSFTAMLLGIFILFFYGLARSDIRANWLNVKKIWCKSRVSDTHMIQNSSISPNFIMNPQIANDNFPTQFYDISRSSSRNSSSKNSNLRAIDNLLQNPPNIDAKIANVDLVTLHRQQYRNNLIIQPPIASSEMFYNPHQSTVARKFFKKQRKNMLKQNLNTVLRRNAAAAAALSDSAASDSSNKSIKKTTNEIIIINGKTESCAQNSQNDDNLKQMIEVINDNECQSLLNETNDENNLPDIKNIDLNETLLYTRTVSQQCSLEYSSESSHNISDIDQEQQKLEVNKYELPEVVDDELLPPECDLTPENNEGMYSITDLSQNINYDDTYIQSQFNSSNDVNVEKMPKKCQSNAIVVKSHSTNRMHNSAQDLSTSSDIDSIYQQMSRHRRRRSLKKRTKSSSDQKMNSNENNLVQSVSLESGLDEFEMNRDSRFQSIANEPLYINSNGKFYDLLGIDKVETTV